MSIPTLIPVQCKPIWKIKNSKAVCEALRQYLRHTKQTNKAFAERIGIDATFPCHVFSGRVAYFSDELVDKFTSIGLILRQVDGVERVFVGVEYCDDIGIALELILDKEKILRSELAKRLKVSWGELNRLLPDSPAKLKPNLITTLWVNRLRKIGIDTAPGIELDDKDQVEDQPIAQQAAEQPVAIKTSTNGSQSFALVWNLVCDECIAQAIRDFMARKEISSVRELAQLVDVHKNTINDLLAQKAVHVTDKVTEQFLASGLDLWALPSRKRELGGVRAIECVLEKLNAQYKLYGYDLRTMAAKMAVNPSRLGQILKGKQELLTPEWIIAFRRIDLDLAPGVKLEQLPVIIDEPKAIDEQQVVDKQQIATTIDNQRQISILPSEAFGKESSTGIRYILSDSLQELEISPSKMVIDHARQSMEVARAMINMLTQIKDLKIRLRIRTELEPEVFELMLAIRLFGEAYPGLLLDLVDMQRRDLDLTKHWKETK